MSAWTSDIGYILIFLLNCAIYENFGWNFQNFTLHLRCRKASLARQPASPSPPWYKAPELAVYTPTLPQGFELPVRAANCTANWAN